MRTNKNVRGIIIKDDKILLIHRFKNGSEYWVVPGGGVEDEETLEEALRREMREETGLEIINFKFLAKNNELDKEQNIYLCEMEEGEAKLGGPEAEDQSEDNQYILTWVPTKKARELTSLYPEVAKNYFSF